MVVSETTCQFLSTHVTSIVENFEAQMCWYFEEERAVD